MNRYSFEWLIQAAASASAAQHDLHWKEVAEGKKGHILCLQGQVTAGCWVQEQQAPLPSSSECTGEAEHRRAARKLCSQDKLTLFACTSASRAVHAGIHKPGVMWTTLTLSHSIPSRDLLLRRVLLAQGWGAQWMNCCIQQLAGKLWRRENCVDPHKALAQVLTHLCIDSRGFCWRVGKFTVSSASNQTSPAQTS